MSSTKLSGSNMQLAMTCPGVQRLPWGKSANEAAQRGTDLHQFMEDAALHGRDVALERVRPDLRQTAEGIDVHALRRDLLGDGYDGSAPPWIPEVSVSYNPGTGTARMLGERLNRDYSACNPGHIPMTVDALIEYGRDTLDGHQYVVMVADWKFGDGFIPAPANNWQLKTAALAMARSCGADVAQAAVVKIAADGTYSIWWAEFSDVDLDVIELEIWDRLEQNELVTGPHCTYCPAFASCPQQAKTALALLDVTSEAITPADIARVWPMIQAVESAARKARAVIEKLIADSGEAIALDNGNVLGLQSSRRTSLRGPVVDEVLRAMDAEGTEIDWDACLSYSQAGLKRAVDPDAYAELMERVERLGGIESKTTKPTLKESVPKGKG